MFSRLNPLEQGALDGLDQVARDGIRAAAADDAAGEDLRQMAYHALEHGLGSSPLVTAALGELDWDAVIDAVCEVDNLSFGSPCCKATLNVRTRGRLLAIESGLDEAEEQHELDCPSCQRRYTVTTATKVKGRSTSYELVFELVPERFVYTHRQSIAANGRSASATAYWQPRADGSPVHPTRSY